MYIPEFWCGFIAGAVIAAVGIIALAIWSTRKDNKR